jgi:hypothetical protein
MTEGVAQSSSMNAVDEGGFIYRQSVAAGYFIAR